MMAKKKSRDKALGRDPFEDMEDLSSEEAVAGVEAASEEEPTSPVTSREAEPETKSLAEEGDVAMPVDEPSLVLAEAEKDEAEVEAVSEAVEEDYHLLEDLIAAIDQEVEEAFGSGAMADLAPDAPSGAHGLEQHVIFGLAGTDYATPIANVTEIGRALEATPVPNVPDWVLGVANLRGDVVSVVDLRAFLGMETTAYSQDSRMMVTHVPTEDMTTSLIVDRVSGIRYLDVDRIGAPAAPIDDQVAPYLRGVCEDDGHLLVVLDLDRLLLSPEMQQFQPL
jgi:purine-binding chemotaxis protein CheW